MKFSVVAQVFKKIEIESSRLEITKLLADLFKQASAVQANIISNFALGTLRPAYEGMQFNFAQKNMVQVITQLTGRSLSDIALEEKVRGDLGSVLQAFGTWNITRDLSVQQVYDELVGFEKIAGTGSVEEKTRVLVDLLSRLDRLSAKFVVRIILGTLRLGFSDMTILDALSWMEVGSKKLKPQLEHAYNICADIGLIAQRLKEGGMQAFEHMQIQLGIPIRPAAAERLPTAEEIFDKLGPCIAQPKLDGFRIQAHVDKTDKNNVRINLFSRNLVDMTHMFPDLTEAIKQLDVQQLIVEGEAIAFDQASGHFLPFQETVKRKRKHGIQEVIEDFPLRLYLFDILYLNGNSLLNQSTVQRYVQLKDVISTTKSDVIHVIEQEAINSAQALQNYFEKNIDLGLEGIVIKRTDAHYQPGKRNFNWIKLKRLEGGNLEDTIDCVILGYYYGSGKRAEFGIGAFLVGIYNQEKDMFQTIAKIGTGLSDVQWKALKEKLETIKMLHQPHNVECKKELIADVWVNPDIVCSVLADEITKSPAHTAGFALRFPRFVGYRPDKSAQQATTLQEIEHMYKDQFLKK